MMQVRTAGRFVIVRAVAMALAGGVVASMQTPAVPPGSSVAKAKELVGLLQAKKLEAIAARQPNQAGRFVAALLIPNAQLLVVGATYTRPLDIEYHLYQKDFMNAYVNLNSSALAGEREFIEDSLHDGLVALPGKNPAHDSFTTGTTRQVFDGDFADPRRRNQKKISQEDYLKAFTAADERYTKLLTVLIDDLKKGSYPAVGYDRLTSGVR